MHLYFLGIGGSGAGPLALIAKQAGYTVSGSDKQATSYLDNLKDKGITDIAIGDSVELISDAHNHHPIDWLVYTKAVDMDENGHQQLDQARALGIRVTKRDELINEILSKHNLQMIAVAGTHGKTTTTAMLSWLFVCLHQPISYLIPAKVSFGDMGSFDPKSQYFIYEADEFDRNFLAYQPKLSLISGVSWDHHEVYPTRQDYIDAFKQFIGQSEQTYLWQNDADYLDLKQPNLFIQKENHPNLDKIKLKGLYNRRDAWLTIASLSRLLGVSEHELIAHINRFPGLARRMEEITPNLYTDYAHTPEKIRAAMNLVTEMAKDSQSEVVVVYEPLTNRRQLFMADDYKDCFKGAKHVYWLPSYLAREDPKDKIVEPAELISHLSDPTIAEPASRDDQLIQKLKQHLKSGHMVVGMAGGGGGSLDDWLRDNFRPTG